MTSYQNKYFGLSIKGQKGNSWYSRKNIRRNVRRSCILAKFHNNFKIRKNLKWFYFHDYFNKLKKVYIFQNYELSIFQQQVAHFLLSLFSSSLYKFSASFIFSKRGFPFVSGRLSARSAAIKDKVLKIVNFWKLLL